MDKQKHRGEEEKKTFSRRYFLELIGSGSLVITAIGGGILSVEYLSPNVLHEPPMKFRVGTISDFPVDSITPITDEKVYIARAKEGYFYAMSAVCTHLGCITGWNADEGVIACPCHGSRYDTEGNVIGGPAPRPLPRYQLSLQDQDRLVVDKGTIVGEDSVLKV